MMSIEECAMAEEGMSIREANADREMSEQEMEDNGWWYLFINKEDMMGKVA